VLDTGQPASVTRSAGHPALTAASRQAGSVTSNRSFGPAALNGGTRPEVTHVTHGSPSGTSRAGASLRAKSAVTSTSDSAAAVAPYLAHVHLRDARPEGGEHWTPVLVGRGLVPFAEVVAALRSLRYDGFVSFEWEKYWHPEIEDPEVSLPDFAGAMRKILGGESATV